jgi:DNA-directed RNA polymerase subunit F
LTDESKTTPETLTDKTEVKAEVKAEVKPEVKEPPADPVAIDKLTLPEGLTITPEASAELNTIFSETGVKTQAGAQKLLDYYHKAMTNSFSAFHGELQKESNTWADQVKKDPEIGGAKLETTVGTIGKALDEFGAPGVREALRVTRAGNHPAIVKTIFNMAQALSEGTHVQGKPSAPPKSLSELFYPSKEA